MTGGNFRTSSSATTVSSPNERGVPKQSRFYFAARLNHSKRPERAVVEGDLIVDWAAKRQAEESPSVKRIDARHLNVKTRSGETPFQLILHQEITPPRGPPTLIL